MDEIILNESARHKTTNLAIYYKHSGTRYVKAYPSKPKEQKVSK